MQITRYDVQSVPGLHGLRSYLTVQAWDHCSMACCHDGIVVYRTVPALVRGPNASSEETLMQLFLPMYLLADFGPLGTLNLEILPMRPFMVRPGVLPLTRILAWRRLYRQLRSLHVNQPPLLASIDGDRVFHWSIGRWSSPPKFSLVEGAPTHRRVKLVTEPQTTSLSSDILRFPYGCRGSGSTIFSGSY